MIAVFINAPGLREVHLVHLAFSIWGGEVIASTVRVKRGK